MITTDQYRARTAFLRFQHALDSLEHELKPLESGMSAELRVEVQIIGHASRRFFTLANQELFPQHTPAAPASQRKEVGIKGK